LERVGETGVERGGLTFEESKRESRKKTLNEASKKRRVLRGLLGAGKRGGRGGKKPTWEPGREGRIFNKIKMGLGRGEADLGKRV